MPDAMANLRVCGLEGIRVSPDGMGENQDPYQKNRISRTDAQSDDAEKPDVQISN